MTKVWITATAYIRLKLRTMGLNLGLRLVDRNYDHVEDFQQWAILDDLFCSIAKSKGRCNCYVCTFSLMYNESEE